VYNPIDWVAFKKLIVDARFSGDEYRVWKPSSGVSAYEPVRSHDRDFHFFVNSHTS
jgi:hypothetical protein